MPHEVGAAKNRTTNDTMNAQSDLPNLAPQYSNLHLHPRLQLHSMQQHDVSVARASSKSVSFFPC